MSRQRLFLIIAIVVLVIGGIVWLRQPKPVNVSVKPVDTGKVEASLSNTRAGTVEACQRTKLSTIIGGRIEYLGVKEGDQVKKGQLLLKLWNDDQQAQATLAQAQIELAKKRSDEVCIAAVNAEKEAKRQSELREKGFVSSSREEAARTEAEVKRASCNTAKADVAQADAKLRATRTEQGRVSLYAPFAGTVAKIVGELGEYSTPSPPGVPTPPAIDLIDESCLYVKAPMDEVDAPKIRTGLPVRISLDALPGQSFPGTVRRVAPYVSAVEKQARTVDIEVDFSQPEKIAHLLVGYSADVEVILDSHDNTLRMPTSALREGRKVLLLNAEGRLEERTPKTGLSNWEYTEILEGLQAGDRLVTAAEKDGAKPGLKAAVNDKPNAGK